jgi:xanthine dehydrogenase YagR molybdenum-binding subunit
MSQPLIGAPYDRVEGPAKVTGEALYTADVRIDGLVHAAVVPSGVAHGRITTIDDSRARQEPGVIEIMTHENAPRVKAAKVDPGDSNLFLLQDANVEFDRQPVAVVIAETFEEAVHAADLVRLEYETRPAIMHLDRAQRFVPKVLFGEPATRARGKPAEAFDAAPVRIKQTYRTPTEHHNPMEPHATVAQWNGDRLVLHDSSQWAFGVRKRIAQVFQISEQQVRVIVPFVGGAFGGKGQMWSHVALAAMASRLVNRPVKLVVTRPQMFGWVGHRPQTEQTVSLGAGHDGRLQAVLHDVRSETSLSDEFIEPSGVFSRNLYATPNYEMSHELRRLTIGKPTYQRGPGESTGSFAVESAMDELAYALNVDPLELRLRNYAEKQPDSGKPYSSKHLRECYRQGAERFGWNRRNPQVRSTYRNGMLVGMGMATASRNVHRSPSSMRIHMNPDGSVIVSCGTIEQGTGSPTVYAQLAAETLNVPFELVHFEFGNTDLPNAPLAAGSQTATSVGSAVVVAAQKMRDRIAALHGRVPPQGIDVTVDAEPGDEEERYATQSFGAQFAEVEVDPDLGIVHVTRFAGAFDGGRILNAKTARSQYIGGIIWGISMALFEHTQFDVHTGRIMNATLENYLVPTNADIPQIDVIMIQEDDPHANPAHVKGIGEVGITGSGAAVANAVYHATGIRVRRLPITPDELLV